MNSDAGAPLISFIVPTLQFDLELRRCIDSIRLAMTNRLAETEIIVVTSSRIIDAKTMPEIDEGVRVVLERKRGIYAAMNDGVRCSQGRYLYFLGKDDIVLPAFADVVTSLRSGDPVAVFADVYWGRKGIVSGRPSRWLVLARNICHQGVVYRRDCFSRFGMYLTAMKVQADHLMNIKILWGEPSSSIRYFPFPVVWYSASGFSSVARDSLFWRLYPLIMSRYVGGWAGCLLRAWRFLRGIGKK